MQNSELVKKMCYSIGILEIGDNTLSVTQHFSLLIGLILQFSQFLSKIIISALSYLEYMTEDQQVIF